MVLSTPRLQLVLQTPTEVLTWVDSLPSEVRAEVSPIWLERVRALTQPDPWACMFTMRKQATEEVIGSCGFKGPPDADGAVEIAYGVDEAFQNQGYATEATAGLVTFASTVQDVRIVRAHTRADNGASSRVLANNGFAFIGEVVDPEDGLVNRWELGVVTTSVDA